MRLRSRFLLILILCGALAIVSSTTAQQNPLVGTWEEIDGRIDRDGMSLPARPNIWIFGGDGYYMTSALPADRPKVNKPLAEMTRDELLARFTDVRVNRGVYRVSGNRVITQRVASLDPNEESARIERVFRIEGDVLTLTAWITRSRHRRGSDV